MVLKAERNGVTETRSKQRVNGDILVDRARAVKFVAKFNSNAASGSTNVSVGIAEFYFFWTID